jgi:CAAX protease family protein
MDSRTSANQPTSARTTSVGAFVITAYALTWALLGPWFYVFNVKYGGEMQPWMWAWVPFAFFGGWGPTLAALIVTAREQGRPGVRRLIRSVTTWRVPPLLFLLVFVFPPAVTTLSLLVVDRGFGTLRDFDAGPAIAAIPVAYLLALPFGPLGEELGWRGFALPRLLPRYGPAVASLLVGVIWTFWHVPMMLWSPGASIPSFMGLSAFAVAVYLVQLTSITVLMTWLFLRTQGSVLVAVLAHLTFNTAEAVVYAGLPKLAVAQERAVHLVNVILLAVVAAAVMWRLAIRRCEHRAA